MLTAMLASVGLYYYVPTLVPALIGIVSFFLLAVYRPDLGLVLVPLAAPLFYRQRGIPLPLPGRDSDLFFPAAEVLLGCLAAAWLVRDGWPFARTRHLPWLPTMFREPWVWLGAVFAAIGLLWLFVAPVPEGDRSRVALREFRWTVAEPVLFLLLMLRWLTTERDLWRMAAAWLIAASLVSREGIEQYLYGQATVMEGVGRATAVYPSATAFGIYAGRALPLALTLAIFLPRDWRLWRWASAALALVIGAGVIVSFTRGAWIGVFAAMVVVAVVTRHRWLAAGLGVAILAGLAALPFIRIERITSMFDFNTEDNTGVARAKIWTAAARIIRDNPFTGIGQDQFLYADPRYGVPQMRFFTTSHPHNWVLDFWLRLGIPGLLWLVAALVFFFRTSLSLCRRWAGTALGALALGLLASMVDFVVHGLLDMAYFTMDLALTFWLTVGIVALLARLRPHEPVPEPNN
ncbi:MAG TPA: O-antigen ligase family protein [Chloroflexia bacterium]|nr:O-antigen ligase family protein [Chloroflexia bacterium]